jgi:hypothetical protein
MAKAITTEMDSRNLEGAMRQLARLTGRSFRDVVRGETRSILEIAARRVRSAKVATIRKNVEERPFVPIEETFYDAPNRAGVRVTKNGFIRYSTDNRYPDRLWAEMQRRKKESIRNRVAKRGLARKSMLQVAQALGMRINVPSYVQRANDKGRDYPENVFGSERGTYAYTIAGTITRTYDRSIFSAFRSAIRGRTAFFRKNLRDGVFKNAQMIAQKYPGLKVNG